MAKVVRTARSQAALYLGKAQEFGSEARAALEDGRHDAAMLNAIHAAISAGDAVAVAIAGVRSADPDHQRAADLLTDAARGSSEIANRAKQLRTLLQKKNLVEYESRRATAKEAADAVERAERLVRWATTTVSRAKV